jgi:predicted outer membrane lipoprotein
MDLYALDPGFSLRSNPGLKLANAFGVMLKLANAFGVIIQFQLRRTISKSN